jgi:multiple sugar transport system permease protein
MALTMASIVTKLEDRPQRHPLHLLDPARDLGPRRRHHLAGHLRAVGLPQFHAVGLGLIDRPILFLGYQNTWVIFVAVVLAEVWRATAIMMVILVAGMGLIPKEYYEAAEVFGAGPWQRFVKVTLPMLKPSLQTALILRVILPPSRSSPWSWRSAAPRCRC